MADTHPSHERGDDDGDGVEIGAREQDEQPLPDHLVEQRCEPRREKSGGTNSQEALGVGRWRLGVKSSVQRSYANAAFFSVLPTISLNSSAVSRSFFSNDLAFTASSSAMRSSSVILMPVFSAPSSIDGGPLFLPRTMFTGFCPTSSGANGTYSSGCSLRHRRTQPAMMPDSTSYSLSPTIGRFGGCCTFARSMTNFEVSTNFSVLIPRFTSWRQSSERTTSSIGTLPARSPRPVMVVCATDAPASRAATVLATPRPKSWWQWISTGFFRRSITFGTTTEIASGVTTPMVSAIVSASMWPSVATCETMSRNLFSSVRVASIVKNTV